MLTILSWRELPSTIPSASRKNYLSAFINAPHEVTVAHRAINSSSRAGESMASTANFVCASGTPKRMVPNCITAERLPQIAPRFACAPRASPRASPSASPSAKIAWYVDDSFHGANSFQQVVYKFMLVL